jgi:hypothetical protein
MPWFLREGDSASVSRTGVAPPRPPNWQTTDHCHSRADEGEPDVLPKLVQIEPGDDNGDREGGRA